MEMINMEIFRVLGNNYLLSVDKYGREVILMGRGIGFGKKKGDRIETDHVCTFFVIQTVILQNT